MASTEFDILETLPLDSERITQVIHYLLDRRNIFHYTFVGSVYWQEQTLTPHAWIELPGHRGRFRIDYRLRQFFGPDAPHRLVHMMNSRGVRYRGEEIEWDLGECELVYRRQAEERWMPRK